MPTLHVHADESGDLNFGPKGTGHYVFAAAWTYQPYEIAQALQRLRYELLREGRDVPHFHAAADAEDTRQGFVRSILQDDRWRFAAVVVRKNRVFPELRDELKFYPTFLASVLRFVLRGRVAGGTDRILIYTDRLPVQKKKKAVITGSGKCLTPQAA